MYCHHSYERRVYLPNKYVIRVTYIKHDGVLISEVAQRIDCFRSPRGISVTPRSTQLPTYLNLILLFAISIFQPNSRDQEHIGRFLDMVTCVFCNIVTSSRIDHHKNLKFFYTLYKSINCNRLLELSSQCIAFQVHMVKKLWNILRSL